MTRSGVIGPGHEVTAEAITRSGGSVLKAPVSIVVRGAAEGALPSSEGGHAKRGLRPRSAPRR